MRRFIWLLFVAFVAADMVAVSGFTPGAAPGDERGAHASHAVHTAFAQGGPCWPSSTPMGALPDQPPPIWCEEPLQTGPATLSQGANSWLDDFDHGLSLADLGPGYRVFGMGDVGGADRLNRFEYWRHADHWMVDVSGRDQTPNDGPWNFGGTMMRPDRSFRFQDGKLVVEADVAAGVSQYHQTAWPEIIVSTAPAPSSAADDLYAYGFFRGYWTFGCRLEDGRGLNCALFDGSGRTEAQGGRRYELPLRDAEGMEVYGAPYAIRDQAWRVCQGTDPDMSCRDRFRLELTRDSVTMLVNGVRIFEASQIPADRQLPPEMLDGEVYAYFASWIGKPDADTVRFHWDHLAINPESAR